MIKQKPYIFVIRLLLIFFSFIIYAHADTEDEIKMKAEQEDANVQFKRGVLFDDKKNAAEASKWYKKAAMQGHIEAQLTIGAYYLVGRGIPKNIDKALNWFGKAAKQGSEEGLGALGQIHAALLVNPSLLETNSKKANILIEKIEKLIDEEKNHNRN